MPRRRPRLCFERAFQVIHPLTHTSPMTDPNVLRYHYRRTSEALRLQKQREASRWLALWITAAALATLAFLA